MAPLRATPLSFGQGAGSCRPSGDRLRTLRIALMPAVLIELFSVQNLGAILGIFFTASGISAVLGPLLAGFIVDATGSYQWGIAFALAAGTLGFAAVALLRIPRDGGIGRPPPSP